MQQNVVKSSLLLSSNKKRHATSFLWSYTKSPPQKKKKKKKVKTWFIKWPGTKSKRKAGLLFLQAFEFTLPGMPWNISVGCCFTALGFFLLAFLPPFPLFDVLCPDHLHMEGKGDTGGLIHCQRHTKAIWAQKNQTFGLLFLLYERRNWEVGVDGKLRERKGKTKEKGRQEVQERLKGGFGTRTRQH